MNIKKIEIKPNLFVWVDTNAEIEDNCYCLQNNNVGTSTGYKIVRCVKADNLNGEHNFGDYTTGRVTKIIAASPELGLEDIPDWVEYLSEVEYPLRANPKKLATIDIDNSIKLDSRKDYIRGYKTAEKELFTEEEVRKAIELARDYNSIGDDFSFSKIEIIELLKKRKNERLHRKTD